MAAPSSDITSTLLRSMFDIVVFLPICAMFIVRLFWRHFCAINLNVQGLVGRGDDKDPEGAKTASGSGDRGRDPGRRLSSGRMVATDRSRGDVHCQTFRCPRRTQ